MKTEIFSEEQFAARMEGEAAEWKRAHLSQGRYLSYDGTKIHYVRAVRDDARASVVLVHGFTEYAERYLEVLYYFYQEGYSVFMADHRGHGRSGRKIPQADRVFVNSFDEYVEDLHFFMEHIVLPSAPDAPLLMFAHSMGGAVGALFLEQYPDYFKAAVLTSPMLKLTMGRVPYPAVEALAAAAKALHWKNRLLPGQKGFCPEPDFENYVGTSRARYEYLFGQRLAHRAYTTTAATYGWSTAAMDATKKLMRDADQISIPLLICQAGLETLVDNAGQERFAELAQKAELVHFPTAKHEIWNSTEDVLSEYYPRVFGFFEKYGT